MSDGLNLNGFNTVKPAGTHNIGEQYAANPKSAFPAKDMSAQGNAGLNQEGSSASLPLSGPDSSDM
jgi:hypothetical protein